MDSPASRPVESMRPWRLISIVSFRSCGGSVSSVVETLPPVAVAIQPGLVVDADARLLRVVFENVLGLKHKEAVVRLACVSALGSMGKTAEPSLAELKVLKTTDPSEDVRKLVSKALDTIESALDK